MKKDLNQFFERQPNASKWLVHLFQQKSRRRLGLIVGAGISADSKIPLWNELINRIAFSVPNFPDSVKKSLQGKVPATYFTQVAFQRFSNAIQNRRQDKEEIDPLHLNLHIQEEWARVVHKCLYQDCPESIDTILNCHPYLQALSLLAYKSPIVLNFNFDDLLSEAMRFCISKDDIIRNHAQQAPDVVWRPPNIERLNITTIYHINGLLPRVRGRKRSEELIFTENSFADAAVSTNTPQYEQVLNRMMGYTNLIIGHSLDDASLKNILRSSRLRTPGLFNYFIYWLNDDKSISEEEISDIFAVNLEVYNLITIFATTDEINEIVTLLNSETNDEFIEKINYYKITRTKYLYYVIGAVGSGKTSLLENLRSFETYEEWLGNPPAEMYKSHDQLTKKEREVVENWVFLQLKQKNRKMRTSEVGFFFMDRAPLDALAFSISNDERKNKAKAILDMFQIDPIEDGQLIFLEASGPELERRNLRRGRFPKESGGQDYLKDQSEQLRELYRINGTTNSETCDAGECARQIGKRALTDDYSPVSVHEILKEVAE